MAHFFVLIINFVTVVFVTTTWAGCKTDYEFDIYGCEVCGRVYPIYKKLESIMINDTKALYRMREAFFPTLIQRSPESEAVNAVLIRVCGILNETCLPRQTCNNNQALRNTRCWNLRWSSSPALNMIDVGQLMAFEPVFPLVIYSTIVGSPSHRNFLVVFHISSDLFPCTPSEDDLTEAIVLLTSWVSVVNID